MSDTVAQLIAGVLLIGTAAIAAFIGYRLGHRRGMREGLLMDDPLRRAYQEEEAGRQERRPPRPPEPPTVVH